MAKQSAAQLKALSTSTFPDNTTGAIVASGHRAFNEAVIDSVVLNGDNPGAVDINSNTEIVLKTPFQAMVSLESGDTIDEIQDYAFVQVSAGDQVDIGSSTNIDINTKNGNINLQGQNLGGKALYKGKEIATAMNLGQYSGEQLTGHNWGTLPVYSNTFLYVMPASIAVGAAITVKSGVSVPGQFPQSPTGWSNSLHFGRCLIAENSTYMHTLESKGVAIRAHKTAEPNFPGIGIGATYDIEIVNTGTAAVAFTGTTILFVELFYTNGS